MKTIVYVLVHEYKDGFTSYVFSSKEKRDEARLMLQKEYAKDFDDDRDFLIADDVVLDAMPWAGGVG